MWHRYAEPLTVLLVTAGLSAVVVAGAGDQSPATVLAGLPLLLFLPGYAVVMALLAPDRSAGESSRSDRVTRTIERFVLSVVTSLLVVSFIGLGLVFSPLSISAPVVVLGLALVTAVALLARVLGQSAATTAPVDPTGLRRRTLTGWRRRSTSTQLVLGLVVCSLLLATASTAYALSTPIRGEQYSEFYLLTENESGELVADDYPTEFSQGEADSVVVGIENGEQRDVDYSVVVELQRLDHSGDGARVLEEQELSRYQSQVRAGGTSRRSVELRPTLSGQRLRLAFFLYTGPAPADPTMASADRDVHLWINVTEPDPVA